MSNLTRRSFLATSAALAGASALLPRAGAQPAKEPAAEGDAHRGPCSISSANGLRAVSRAMELVSDGYDPADAVVQGVRIIEDDPNDDSVGLGGLPNYEGVVELDACVMHGPTHKTGAVASLRNIKNPAMVALLVLRRTDHCLLVGEGALRFAKQYGFQEENLLTEKARKEWLAWRANISHDDDYLNDDELDAPVGKTWDKLPQEEAAPAKTSSSGGTGISSGGTGVSSGGTGVPPVVRSKPYRTDVTGTIHCSALTPKGDIASCTTTSGLNWKIPGRVGDSPIIGAGNYCDNSLGAAGCTGRGEATIVNLCAFHMVMLLDRGLTPTEAALEVAKKVVDHTKEKRLLAAGGKPNFDLKLYCLRKDGAHGSASLYAGGQYSVHDAKGARHLPCAYLFEKRP